ncbi:MAG: type IX secretion system protein PorQ [Flavobacteriales bacterium]|nr:type IX secretion system protein PorQ [Flavobacteriales bacterium]
MSNRFLFSVRSLITCVIAVVSLPQTGHAQIGGTTSYDFLNLVTSARIGALGGHYLAINGDHDLSLAAVNPSLLTKDLHRNLVLDYVNYFSDVNFGGVDYAHHVEKVGTFSGRLKYVNYGQFTETNEQGIEIGQFRASDLLFQVGVSRKMDSLFTVGMHLGLVYSALAQYTSTALTTDWAVTYAKPGGSFAASLMVLNLGAPLSSYVEGYREKLPLEIRLGMSKKLAHLPLRYIITLTHLEKANLNYENSNQPTILVDPLTGEDIKPKKMIGDKIMRHVGVGAEFSPSDNFHVRFGYDYRRRQELKVATKTGTIGFSWGFGFKVSKFHVNYGRASYHLAGASNHFSITTGLSEFLSKAND